MLSLNFVVRRVTIIHNLQKNATTLHSKLYCGQEDVAMGSNFPKLQNKCHWWRMHKPTDHSTNVG